MSDIGAYLRAQRLKKGWSLREAAAQIGISYSRLTELERGKSYTTDHPTRAGREIIERIAVAYGLDSQVLLAEAGYAVGEVSELSSDARRLLMLYESLPNDRKKLLLRTALAFAEPDQGE